MSLADTHTFPTEQSLGRNQGWQGLETRPSFRAKLHPDVRYFEQLNDIGGSSFSGKTLLERATGKFYTPEWLAAFLAQKVTAEGTFVGRTLSVLDPFAGDGRLLVHFLNEIAHREQTRKARWLVSAWDTDGEALQLARDRIEATCRSLSLNIQLDLRIQNTFSAFTSEDKRYDVVVTNPPWETLKPDARELRHLSTSSRSTYVENLRAYDSCLAHALPHSQPKTKFAGWGTNLARCGLELSIKLLKPNALCGIILPSALFADQISAPLRRWLFTHSTLRRLDHFPAEARTFPGVDQGCALATIQKSPPESFRPLLARYDRNRRHISESIIRLTTEELERIDHALPLDLDLPDLQLLLHLGRLPRLDQQSDLWLGRELDETNYRSFLSPRGTQPFVKGRMIERFGPLKGSEGFVRETLRAIPATTRFPRVGWRDVSRRSQARRMIATLIPPGYVAGNSVNLAAFPDADGESRLLALLSVLNSTPFEFQLRARLGTGHVSLGAVRQISVPDFRDACLVKKLSKLARQRLAGEISAERKIDALVNEAHGLDDSALASMFKRISGM